MIPAKSLTGSGQGVFDLINFNFDDLQCIIRGFLTEATCYCSFSGLGSKIWKYQVENTEHRLVCSKKKKNTVYVLATGGQNSARLSLYELILVNISKQFTMFTYLGLM